MSPDQESKYQKNQIEIANMSDKHQIIRLEGDHMVFFTRGKSKIVVDAVNSIEADHFVRFIVKAS